MKRKMSAKERLFYEIRHEERMLELERYWHGKNHRIPMRRAQKIAHMKYKYERMI